jgi:hypothetical protein
MDYTSLNKRYTECHLCADILCAIMLDIVMLNVVAPFY